MAAKECCCYITPFRAMTNPFFNQKFDSGMYAVLSWFGINLMVSFHISQFRRYLFILTWSLLLSYIDDMLSATAQFVTKNSIIRHLPHHHGISRDFQCQPNVDLG